MTGAPPHHQIAPTSSKPVVHSPAPCSNGTVAPVVQGSSAASRPVRYRALHPDRQHAPALPAAQFSGHVCARPVTGQPPPPRTRTDSPPPPVPRQPAAATEHKKRSSRGDYFVDIYPCVITSGSEMMSSIRVSAEF